MKAVILVGGEGTRLRPLTCNTPKPMVPIVNRPFLEHMIDYLRKYDIDDIILSMCYLPDRIQSYFGDGSSFGVKLTYVVENTPLGTAGAVKNVERYLDDTCFVLNGDVMTDLDLTAMLAFHREHRSKVTISLAPVEDPTAYGVVETNSEGHVKRFIEKPSWDAVTTNLINAGTYVLEPDVLKYVPPNLYYMFEHGLFPVLLQVGDPLYGFATNDYWIDIGTPEKYITVHHDILMGKIQKPFPGQCVHDGIWIGRGAQVDPTVKMTGPVVIGEESVIGPGVRITGPLVMGNQCQIGHDTVIEDAVLWHNVRVGHHVTMKRCVVASNCLLEDSTWLTNGAIIGDDVTIRTGNRLEHGIRIWANRILEPNTITF
jgi:mannose-1-phosphate guanylyltransferase